MKVDPFRISASSIILNLTICYNILLQMFGVAHVRFNAIL